MAPVPACRRLIYRNLHTGCVKPLNAITVFIQAAYMSAAIEVQSVSSSAAGHLPCGSYTGKGWCDRNRIFALQNTSSNPAFCHSFNDGTFSWAQVASYQRWPSWAELWWHLPICVNEMTPLSLWVTVIFTETVVAAEIRASLWRSLASFA